MAAIIIYSDFNTLGSWVKDLYSQIASDAIFVTGQFFYQLIDIEGNLDGDFINEALALYDKLHEKLKEQHIDQEVK